MAQENLSIGELLKRMKQLCGSDNRLANKLGVTERTVNSWLHKPEDELRGLRADNIDKILSVSRDMGIQNELFSKGPELWNDAEDYNTNLLFDPGLPPSNTGHFRTHNLSFLGFEVTSQFGASASILTSSALRVRFLAHAGCDVITFKTVRSEECGSHPPQNILYCETEELVDSDKRASRTRVVTSSRKSFDPKRGMINRFGIPSTAFEAWKAEFRAAKNELRYGQLLILSVAGTANRDHPTSVLVKDFKRTVSLGIAAGADIIELNLSCPNCNGTEGEVYHDLDLTLAICKQLASLSSSQKILLKIGYMPRENLRRFVLETAPYVHGYSLINTIPVKAMRQGQRGLEPAFGGLKCGLSGGPILPCGLRCVEWLATTIKAEGMRNIGIIGMGGVTEPAHAKMYLDAGADIVQSTTALFHDSFFGMKVRAFLDSQLLSRRHTADEEREIARVHWSRAVQQLENEARGSEPVLAKIDEAALREFREWERLHEKTVDLGPRRPMAIPSVEEFRQRIKQRCPMP